MVRTGAASSSGAASPGGASAPGTESSGVPTTTTLIAVKEEIDDNEAMSGAPPAMVSAVDGPYANIHVIEDEAQAEVRISVRQKASPCYFAALAWPDQYKTDS